MLYERTWFTVFQFILKVFSRVEATTLCRALKSSTLYWSDFLNGADFVLSHAGILLPDIFTKQTLDYTYSGLKPKITHPSKYLLCN